MFFHSIVPNLLTPERIASEIRKLETKRKKIHVVVGEFKKLAIAKRLLSQKAMKKVVVSEIYNEYKDTWN